MMSQSQAGGGLGKATWQPSMLSLAASRASQAVFWSLTSVDRLFLHQDYFSARPLETSRTVLAVFPLSGHRPCLRLYFSCESCVELCVNPVGCGSSAVGSRHVLIVPVSSRCHPSATDAV